MASPSALAVSSVTLIMYYAVCSSTMLVVNKVTVHELHAPSFILFCQLFASAVFVRLAGAMGAIDVDKLEWKKVRSFLLVVVGFVGTIFANMKVLQNSNVETFITFRCSTPLCMSICDWIFLGRELPNARSWVCLLFLILGSAGYVVVDTAFKLEAYVWLFIWYFFFIFDTLYVKHTCESVAMSSWGRVYYTNVIAAAPFLISSIYLKEYRSLMETTWGAEVLLPLGLSCLIGLGMSHSAYLLRDQLSATTFTIVGIVCKVATVILNFAIWDQHASKEGIFFLFLCVAAGSLYQQSPKRPEAQPK